MKFKTFPKKRRVSWPNYYWNYCVGNRYLLKRLKGLSSGHHSVINGLTASKQCWSQHGTTIFLFFHEFLINWVGKSLPSSHLKSSECLLTRWLPMTNIPVAIWRFSGNTFERLYLKKERLFLIFYCISEMCMKLRTFRKTKRVSQVNYCWYYCIRKRCLLKRLKGLASTHYSVINVLTGSKHCWS